MHVGSNHRAEDERLQSPLMPDGQVSGAVATD